jgi:5'-nucleotidase
MFSQKPQILLTNDDGIDSPGLWAAAKSLSTLGHVWVVAPREQSTSAGRSTPPSSDGQIVPRTYHVDGVEWTAYAIGGTPAQAVLHGLYEVLPGAPDLVVAGINYGCNAGPSITNSGTVGAAIEAAARKIPAIAVSLETKMEQELSHSLEVNFSAAAAFTATFASLMINHHLPADVHILKVEVPSNATFETAWEISRLSIDPLYIPNITRRQSWDVSQKIWYTIQSDKNGFEPGTDVHTVLVKRMVAVTPLSIDMTSRIPVAELESILRSQAPGC